MPPPFKPRVAKPKVTRKPRQKTEQFTMQAPTEALLAEMGLPFVHVPDVIYQLCSPMYRTLTPRNKVLISRAFKNFPDCLVLHPSGRYLMLELKSESGKPTPGQLEMQASFPDTVYQIHNSMATVREALIKFKEEAECQQQK